LYLNNILLLTVIAALYASHPAEQLIDSKRLCNVIVTAHVQPHHYIPLIIQRSQKQHRHILPAFCIRTDIIATSIRKTDIQQQQIKRLLIQLLQCRTFMVAPHHLIAFLFQCIHKTHRNGLIILNKQQFHKHPLPFLFCIIKNKYHPVYVCDKTVTI
jgi:hypothetical protein